METLCTFCYQQLKTELIKDIVENGKIYTLYLCEECRVGITVPMPSPEELSVLYTRGNYRSISGKRFNPFIEFFIYISRLQRRRRIEKYKKKGHILDIGCGRGLFLDIMRRHGWSVAGVEFNEETASYAAETYGINVMTGNPQDWGFDKESFDVITINHVIEHVHKPAEMISECNRLLRKGGLLVIAVPNIYSLQASAGKGSWFHLDIPHHLYHFSEEGLFILLKKNSYKILKTRRFDMEYNPFGWLQTLLNLSGIKKNFFYDLLKRPELKRKESSNSKKRDFILTLLLLPLYVPLSFLLSAFESLILKRGGTIEVYAVKE
jgi:2-polyprenyl-3-methyl-5-hydroxy-6-metoxy-1,4-benzoquinol methylase